MIDKINLIGKDNFIEILCFNKRLIADYNDNNKKVENLINKYNLFHSHDEMRYQTQFNLENRRSS